MIAWTEDAATDLTAIGDYSPTWRPLIPIVVLALLAVDGASINAALVDVGDQIWGQHVAFVEGAPETNDRFGSAVATGDFDGDGRDDLAVGSPGESVNGLARAGAVNVIYGTNGGLHATGDQIWSQESAGVEGVAEMDDQFGFALAAGDFNNDGYDDLAVGVPFETIPEKALTDPNSGAVNVLYGGPSGLSASFNQIWTQDSPGLNGVADPFDRLGHALAAGDFNGDGYDDLAVGAPGEDIEFVEHYCGPGAVNVLYGSLFRLTATGDQVWTQDSTNVEGTGENYECFGRALAAGDFDSDGFSDLAIGVPAPSVLTTTSVLINTGAGAVNVLYGTASGLSAAGDQLWSQGLGGVQGVADDGNQFGWALAAGDLNGDGFDDLAIGAPGDGGGAVSVLYGTVNGLNAAADQRWHQDSSGVLGDGSSDDLTGSLQDVFGSTIVYTGGFGAALSIGDFDGDGEDDLAIGVPGEDIDGVVNAGAVNVLYGSPGGLTATGDQLWHQAATGVSGNPQYNDRFGSALAAGDFDGDGSDDLSIGVPDESADGHLRAGVVQILYGAQQSVGGDLPDVPASGSP
jgi:hypothetical protein